jgi:hypothetical protein
MNAPSRTPPSVLVTAERLRTLLREDPAKFEEALQQLIETCPDPDTVRFWTAMKDFARRPSNT